MLFLGVITLAAMVLYFFAVPLLIYFTFKFQAYPDIEPIDPTGGMPKPVMQFFDECYRQLIPLQFEHMGTCSIPSAVTNAKTLLALYQNHKAGTNSISTAIYGKVNGTWTLQQQYVEHSTKLSDEITINTGNQPGISAFPTPRGYVNTQHPDLQAMSELFEAHLAIIKHHGQGLRPVMELQSKFNGDAPKYIATGIHGELIKAASAGRLKLKQLEHDNSTATPQVSNPYQSPAPSVIEQGSHFVATLPGAYLITWKELWPIKPIVARMKYAKDRNVRRAAGFPK